MRFSHGGQVRWLGGKHVGVWWLDFFSTCSVTFNTHRDIHQIPMPDINDGQAPSCRAAPPPLSLSSLSATSLASICCTPTAPPSSSTSIYPSLGPLQSLFSSLFTKVYVKQLTKKYDIKLLTKHAHTTFVT